MKTAGLDDYVITVTGLCRGCGIDLSGAETDKSGAGEANVDAGSVYEVLKNNNNETDKNSDFGV